MALINVPNINNLDAATPELWNSRFGTIANELNGNLDAANLKDAAVTAPKLATDSVTTGKIADAAVTPPKWYNPYKFGVYLAASPGLTGNVITKVPFETEEFDTNNNFDTTLNRYVAPVNGFYHVDAVISVSSAGTSASVGSSAYLYKNGATYKNGILISGSGNGNTQPRMSISVTCQLNAGDYLECFAFCGETRNIAGGQNITYFSGFLVSPT